MSTLKLTLSKKPFEVMVTGEKKTEYRTKSKWIESRLFRKGVPRTYQFVEFINGYGKDKPRFTVEFKGFELMESVKETYSNGLRVVSDEPLYAIHLGEIV